MKKQNFAPSLILATVAFGVFVAADDLTVVSTMLRQIVFDLEIPLPQELDKAAWIVNAYLIAYVAVMPFVGRLSDLWGRRAVYVGAFALFMLGSAWIPFAPDLGWFIAGRVLTAVGGGAMVPVAMSVVGDVYRPEKRATALGTLGAIDTAGWVWGPLYGALLVRFLSWEWQFYLNIPLSLLGIAAAWRVLADLPAPATRQKIDWLGAAALTAALLSLNLGLLQGGDAQNAGGFADLETAVSPNALYYYLFAALMFAAFLFIQRRLARAGDASRPPLIPLSLFRRPNFSVAILINFLVGGVLIIAMVNVPLVVNVLVFDPQTAALTSGLLLSVMTGAMAIMAYLGGRLTEKRGYTLVAALGLIFCAVGFGLMGYSWRTTPVYSQMAWQLAILGIGFGLVLTPIGTAVINAAPDDQRGAASALSIVLRLMGMSVGLSALTAWGLRRFNALRTQIVLPDLPFSDPVYRQAIVDGLTQTTIQALAETFFIAAVVALAGLALALRLRQT